MIAALLVASLMATAPSPTYTPPWTTFAEAQPYSVGQRMAACPGGQQVLVIGLKHGEDLHVVYTEIERQRVMWVYFRFNGETPTWVGVGVMGAEPGRIPSLQWTPGDRAETQWPKGPCDYLAGPIA